MSLISCLECGHSVSTLASACPQCGAPVQQAPAPAETRLPAPYPSWGKMLGLAAGTFLIGGYVLILVLGSSPSAKVDASYGAPHSQPVTAAPAAPAHHYVAIVRGYFGYAGALSDNDRAMGLASKPLTLVGYQGKRGAEYTFSVSDGGPYVDLITCNDPCEFAQSMGMGGNKVFQVQPGTILGDMIEDARNGELDSAAPAVPALVAPPMEATRPQASPPATPHHLPHYGIPASQPKA